MVSKFYSLHCGKPLYQLEHSACIQFPCLFTHFQTYLGEHTFPPPPSVRLFHSLKKNTKKQKNLTFLSSPSSFSPRIPRSFK